MSDKVKKIGDEKEVYDDYLKKYNFQKRLTDKLDNYDKDFSQDEINEITLWKVNRYAKIDPAVLTDLNKIRGAKSFDEARNVILKLLKTPGVQMPMASTYLRFLNPNVFQIIDKRAYRALFGDNLKEPKGEKALGFYFNYLTELRKKCVEQNINFKDADRIFYQFDKDKNKGLKLSGDEKKKRKKT